MYFWRSLPLMLSLFWVPALLGQNATTTTHDFEDVSFWEYVLGNPGDYIWVLVVFVVLGYFLWRGLRLGEDD